MAVSKSSNPSVRYGDLLPRVVVGVVLAVLAVGATYAGGWIFNIMIAAFVMLIYGEWCAMHRRGRMLRLSGMLALAGAALLTAQLLPAYAIGLVAVAATLLTLAGGTAGPGIAYAGLPAIAIIWLRQQDEGFALVIWTLAIVWATDVMAYFAGRIIGGPKIAPAISPSKTWAGLGGGMLGAGLVAAMLSHQFDLGFDEPVAALAGAGLAVAAQAGDFFESNLKRKAGVKDSGTLLPGHGGVMDRLDGVVPVSALVAVIVWLQQ